MKHLILLFTFSFIALYANAQVEKILGDWAVIDEKTGEKVSVFHFFKADDGYYYGKLIDSSDPDFENAVCENCKGEDKGKPLKGLLLFKKFKVDGDKLVGGRAMDTRNGKTYYGSISYNAKTDRLRMRGSLDKSGLIGITQYFSRHKTR